MALYCRRSSAGRCTRTGRPVNGQRGGELRFVHRENSDDVRAGRGVGIGNELPLSMEVAERAVVNGGILAFALPGRRSLF